MVEKWFRQVNFSNYRCFVWNVVDGTMHLSWFVS